jgi:hypothetical protein
MNFRKITHFLFLFFIALGAALPSPYPVRAFGISPPQVINDRLVPSAHYEQLITMSRAEADQEVVCTVEMNLPGFENWVTFDPGQSFVIPKGEKIARLNVKVDVPKDAKPGRSRGTIRVTVAPTQKETGKINIVLGAQIDVDLTITSEQINEMEVKQVKMPDLEEKWKVLVNMRVENKGNTDVGPDKVTLDIYDSSFKQLIKSGEKTRLSKVKAFQTGEILAFFKADLPIGQYWGDVKVYKAGEIVWEEKAIFTVKEKGTLPPQPKEPFFDSIGIDPKWAVAVLFVLIVISITLVLLKINGGGKRRLKKTPRKI